MHCTVLDVSGRESSGGSFIHMLLSATCWCKGCAQAELNRVQTWHFSMWFGVLPAWQLCLEEEPFRELSFQVSTHIQKHDIWWLPFRGHIALFLPYFLYWTIQGPTYGSKGEYKVRVHEETPVSDTFESNQGPPSAHCTRMNGISTT